MSSEFSIGEIGRIETDALGAIEVSRDLRELDVIRVKYLGKKGILTARLKSLGSTDPARRPALGAELNRVRSRIEKALAEATEEARSKGESDRLEKEIFDISLPGRAARYGSYHPVTQTMEEIVAILSELGFAIEESAEIETDQTNFKALNFPDDHPARDEQDTFYIDNGRALLRTHTSPTQIHAMLKRSAPMAVIAPGRVFRRDHDITHSPVFHQVEGFLIDRSISMSHLVGTLGALGRALFGESRKVRLRPSFFPFTEPSAEVDISCGVCGGDGCRICSMSGWIEILGAGMIDPAVLLNCSIDPERWSGFAFGMGLERIAMLKYGIGDIRALYENDVRYLNLFR